MLGVIGFFGWQYRLSLAEASRHRIESGRTQARAHALEQIDEVQTLVDRGKNQLAFDILLEIEKTVPDNPRLVQLREECSQEWTISSNPPGAELSRRDYGETGQSWIRVARTEETPQRIRIPRGVYLWKATLVGYQDVLGLRMPDAAHFDLDRLDLLPEGMVRIPAGEVSQPSQAFMYQYEKFNLPSYFIDRYEVSNAEYTEFVAAGGYENTSYWDGLKFFDEQDEPLSWDQAMSRFVDRSGKRGPATWENGGCPVGTENQPVTGVSWYEAMAYARFVNKSLPTVYHWESASQHERVGWITAGQVLERFYFGDHPLNRSQLQDHGLFGTLGTGGNAREWTRNSTQENDRFILGGGCGDTLYMVITLDHSPPILRAENFGFRCMKLIEDEPSSLSNVFVSIPWASAPPAESLLDQKTFELVIGDRFSFDHSLPLDVHGKRLDEGRWIHEIVSFNAAYEKPDGQWDRVTVHFYLPKTPVPQGGFQTVVYMPPLDAAFMSSIRPLENEYGLDRILSSGRAVLRPIYAGSYQRKSDANANKEQDEIKVVQDIMRSVDWLCERDEIDQSRIALYGFSLGALNSYPALAIDPRIRAAIFQGAGLHIEPLRERKVFSEWVHALPRIKIPVLMIGGQDDQIRPISVSQRPMLELLGSNDKELMVLPGGHMLPNDLVMSKLLEWLDQRFGKPASE